MIFFGSFKATNINGSVNSDIQGSNVNQTSQKLQPTLRGLTTPLSSGQIDKLNTFVAALKSGLSISALSDAFDVMYVLANETAEAGLKTL